MRILFPLAVLLFLIAPSVCWGSKLLKFAPDAPNTESLVTAVSVLSDSRGSITISGDDTPFVVQSGTTIIIDGHSATLGDVKKGMQALSRTASDSSSPEIDLKTVQTKAP
jgi:hypothetical protein